MTVRRIEYVTDFVDGRWEVQSVIYEAVRQFDSWDDADALKESLRRAEKQRQVIAEVRYVCEDCSFSTDVVYDAAAHSYAHDNGHRTVVKVPHIDGSPAQGRQGSTSSDPPAPGLHNDGCRTPNEEGGSVGS